MARLLFFIAAVLFFFFGLGFLGGRSQNIPLILLSVVFFLLMIFSPSKTTSSTPKMLLHLPEKQQQELRDLIKENKQIQAIKYYRELTGASLKQSKEYVETLERDVLQTGSTPDIKLPLPADLELAIRAIKAHSLINAVREVQGLTGVSIREAKDYVDKL